MFNTPIITTRLNAMLAALALAAVSALVAGGVGYGVGHHSAKADGDAALATLQRNSALAKARAADEARLRLLAEVKRANGMEQMLVDEKATHAKEKESLLRRIANVTTAYIPAPGRAPVSLPRAVFTTGFVREYNAALGVLAADEGTATAGNGGAAEAAQSADAWLRDSGLSQSDILAHIADYGERCRNIEAQVNRLIDLDQEVANGFR